jgi:DNA-binding transcriptional LysR family regulator
MHRDDLTDLTAFAAVAEVGSFTKAAAKSGLSQSALSRAVRHLEDRHGVALLVRSTRHVALTDAGEALLATVQPALQAIEDQLGQLENWRDRPAGRLRLTMIRMAANTVLGPVLQSFLAEHPEVELEVHADDRFLDIVSGRFDAGIRFGPHLENEMVAVPVGGKMRPVVVGSPAYLAEIEAPASPDDLSRHRCIRYRMPGNGPLYDWHFERGEEAWDVPVSGGPIFNDGQLIEMAALKGCGLAYLFEDQVADHLRTGRLQQVLEPFCAPFPGYHLYYHSRRHLRPALRRLIDTLT